MVVPRPRSIYFLRDTTVEDADVEDTDFGFCVVVVGLDLFRTYVGVVDDGDERTNSSELDTVVVRYF